MDNFITVRIINIGIVSSIRRIVISWFFFTTLRICTFISSIGLTHWDIDWIPWLIQSHSFTSKVLAKICIDTFQIHHHVTLLSGCTETFMQISNLSSKQPSWNLKWWIHEKSMPPSHGHRWEASLKPPGPSAVVPCQRPKKQKCHSGHQHWTAKHVNEIFAHHRSHHHTTMECGSHQSIHCICNHQPCSLFLEGLDWNFGSWHWAASFQLCEHSQRSCCNLNQTHALLSCNPVGMAHSPQFTIISDFIKTGHEKTNQPSKKSSPLPT